MTHISGYVDRAVVSISHNEVLYVCYTHEQDRAQNCKVILPGLNQLNVFLFAYWFTFAVFLVFCLLVFYFFLRGQGRKGLFYETYIEG